MEVMFYTDQKYIGDILQRKMYLTDRLAYCIATFCGLFSNFSHFWLNTKIDLKSWIEIKLN